MFIVCKKFVSADYNNFVVFRLQINLMFSFIVRPAWVEPGASSRSTGWCRKSKPENLVKTIESIKHLNYLIQCFESFESFETFESFESFESIKHLNYLIQCFDYISMVSIFIAIYRLMQKIEAGNSSQNIDVFNQVLKLREDRCLMVW